MSWANDYVGIPFRWGGYSRAGCSCWGLLWLVQREVFGNHLPRHDEAVQAVQGGAAPETGIWQSGIVADPIPMREAGPGDVLKMWGVVNGRRAPLHVGTFVDRSSVLHIEAGTDSVIEHVTSPRFRWRPIQAFRIV